MRRSVLESNENLGYQFERLATTGWFEEEDPLPSITREECGLTATRAIIASRTVNEASLQANFVNT